MAALRYLWQQFLGLRIWRLRYSLRALLVFVTLFMVWGGYHANRGWKERQAETFLVSLGSKLQRGAYLPISPYHFIVDARVSSKLEPGVVRALSDLPYLRMLTLDAADHRDYGRLGFSETVGAHQVAPQFAIEECLRNAQLHALRLDGWILSDGACRSISQQRQLEVLVLRRCNLTEEGLAEIVRAPKLTILRIPFCNVSGSKLVDSPGSNTLQEVNCHGTPIKPEFGGYLARCSNVKYLEIGYSLDPKQVNDHFITKLGAHESIETFLMTNAEITDTSIPTISLMPSLKYVSLPESISHHGRKALFAAKPHLKE